MIAAETMLTNFGALAIFFAGIVALALCILIVDLVLFITTGTSLLYVAERWLFEDVRR